MNLCVLLATYDIMKRDELIDLLDITAPNIILSIESFDSELAFASTLLCLSQIIDNPKKITQTLTTCSIVKTIIEMIDYHLLLISTSKAALTLLF